jgi:SecD/SecF fusion protein
MSKRNLWKLLLIVFVTAWAVYELTPLKGRDLSVVFQEKAVGTDTNFTAIVQRAKLLAQKTPDRVYGNLREAIGTNDITRYFPNVDVKAEKDRTRAILNYLQRKAAGKIKLGLDLQGGTSYLVGMSTNNLSADTDRTVMLEQAVEVLRKRVDRFGVAEPIIQPASADRILIQLPGLSEADKEGARTQLEKAAFLEFRMVHTESAKLLADGIVPPGYEILQETRKNERGIEELVPYVVNKKAERGLTGKYVKRAIVIRDNITNKPQIAFEMDAEGGRLFGDITRENVQNQLAIVLDGELYSAPVIQTEITGGSGVISGNFDIKEAVALANVLENPLETPVKILEAREVEPSLGKDSIKSGVRSALIGTVAVAAFMLVYYMFAGVVANIALMLNIVILLGVMCSVETTLTLPGIAGIVLTIGMAVDANVLIFERIREEQAAGKSIRGAISAGYDRAFSTIFDSNLTTLIASVILIYMGTGPVKGFGVALTIGVSVSMFTALVVTRLIFDLLVEKNLLKSVSMMHIIRGSKIDFMKHAKLAFVLSWTLILVGCGYGFYRAYFGHGVSGPDFAGGDRLTLSFNQRVAVEDVRKTVETLKLGDAQIQYQKDIVANSETLTVVSAFESGNKISAELKAKFPQAGFKVESMDAIGPVVGNEIKKAAVVSALLAIFGILVYVAFRYEFSFAVGAVIAIIHDILMTMGWFFLTGRELNAPIVAAVLTIIGFSINDTIVIFDRIREDLKLGIRGSFREIMNKALNQTLSRTIITSGTVFLATASLYLFGGSVVNDFAFTFLVGIITGTYSSIYIAGAIVLWWHKGARPSIGSGIVAQDGEAPAKA